MKRICALLFLGALCLGLLIYSFLDRPGAEPVVTEPVVTEPTVTEETADTVPPTEPTEAGAVLRIGCGDELWQTVWEQLAEEYSVTSGMEVEMVDYDDPGATMVIHTDATAAIDQCAQWMDLYDTVAYAQLASWGMALRHDGKVCAIPTQVQCVGLVCNTQLLAASGYSLSEIDSFQKLQLVVGQLADAGVSAFATPDLELLTLVAATAPDHSRAFVDLYMANAVPEGDGQTQLLEGQAVFWLGSADVYEALSAITPGILPVYLGMENEQNQTLCAIGGGFLSIRKDAGEEAIQAALAFLDHLVIPEEGGTAPLDQLTVMAPFRQTTYCANVLEQRLRDDLTAGKSCLVCVQPELLPEEATGLLAGYLETPEDGTWVAFRNAVG